MVLVAMPIDQSRVRMRGQPSVKALGGARRVPRVLSPRINNGINGSRDSEALAG